MYKKYVSIFSAILGGFSIKLLMVVKKLSNRIPCLFDVLELKNRFLVLIFIKKSH